MHSFQQSAYQLKMGFKTRCFLMGKYRKYSSQNWHEFFPFMSLIKEGRWLMSEKPNGWFKKTKYSLGWSPQMWKEPGRAGGGLPLMCLLFFAFPTKDEHIQKQWWNRGKMPGKRFAVSIMHYANAFGSFKRPRKCPNQCGAVALSESQRGTLRGSRLNYGCAVQSWTL